MTLELMNLSHEKAWLRSRKRSPSRPQLSAATTGARIRVLASNRLGPFTTGLRIKRASGKTSCGFRFQVTTPSKRLNPNFNKIS